MSARVGVIVVGHGSTASEMLAAASGIVSDDALSGVVAIDAGEGETQAFCDDLCDAIAREEQGRGVLMLVDLVGASPCTCGEREAVGHDLVVLGGLNLAMLLKLASLDRTRHSATELAEACAQSARRAVSLHERGGRGGGVR
jgi:PTS system mannose-specific IIA component